MRGKIRGSEEEKSKGLEVERQEEEFTRLFRKNTKTEDNFILIFTHIKGI